MRHFGSFIIGAAAGGVLGAVLAILLAPASGSQLRDNLKSRGSGIIDEVKRAAADRRALLEQEINELRYRP